MTHINYINDTGQVIGSSQSKTGKAQITGAFENALS